MRTGAYIAFSFAILVGCAQRDDDVVSPAPIELPETGTPLFAGVVIQNEWSPASNWDTTYLDTLAMSPYATNPQEVILSGSSVVNGTWTLDADGYLWQNWGGGGGGASGSCQLVLGAEPDSLVLTYHYSSSLPGNQVSRNKVFRGARIN